jgi:carbon monoxide dehydrogenase subunit G
VEMQHHFTVPVPVDVAWPALLDPERVAPCMPGATLTRAEGSEFAGSVKVRLGPISLLYKGTGNFTEVDADARRVVIDASGKDSRGNGTASATVTAVLTDQGGSTEVRVDTDLKVTGRPAQLGRGLISEVGGKILGQFADCLAERLAGSPAPEEPEVEEGASTAPAATDRAAAASGNGNGERPAAASSTTSGTLPGWRMTSASGELGEAATTSAATTPEPKADAVRDERADDAIDLLGAAGAPVLKRLAPVAAVVALVAIVLWRRRRKR